MAYTDTDSGPRFKVLTENGVGSPFKRRATIRDRLLESILPILWGLVVLVAVVLVVWW